MKRIILFGMLLCLALPSLAQKCYTAEMVEPPTKISTGLPFVPVYMNSKKTIYMSAAASNRYQRDPSILKQLVPTKIKNQKVFVLPEEKRKIERENKLNLTLEEKLQKKAEEQAFCKENAACKDLLSLWEAMGENEKKVATLKKEAQNNFEQALREQKSIYLKTKLGQSAVRFVEEKQYSRLLGNHFDIDALEEFLFSGQPEFTVTGWSDTFLRLCNFKRRGILSQTQEQKILRFVERAHQQFSEGTLPLISQPNKNPYKSGAALFNKSASCTSIYF